MDNPMLIQTITIIGSMVALVVLAWRVFTKFFDTFRQGIETSLDGLRSEMNASYDGLRSEMNASIDGLRSEMKASYDGLRSEMKADYEGLKTIVQNGTKEHEHFRSSIQDLNKEILEMTWNDLEESENENLLIHVRTSKTNRAGEDTDIRLLKNGFAKAVRDLRSGASEHDPVIGLKPQRISQRVTALAKQAGITHKLTAHSGRVGLASELTARGASTTETMLAGNWKTAPRVSFRGGYPAGSHPKSLWIEV